MGHSVGDKLKWLEAKRSFWDVDQLVFELCGPNKKNWQDIVDSCAEDLEGDLLERVLALLAMPEIREKPGTLQMYMPLSSSTGVGNRALQQFVSTGPLADDLIDDLVDEALGSGRGSSEWYKAMDSANNLLLVLDTLMDRFDFTRTRFTALVELLTCRVVKLAGETHQHPPAFICPNMFPEGVQYIQRVFVILKCHPST